MGITVLGVGNPIMGDDGVGLRLLDELGRPADGTVGLDVRLPASESSSTGSDMCRPHIEPPNHRTVTFVDGGTGGMALLEIVEDAQRLLILDAVAGEEPGQIKVVEGDQIPRLLSQKVSPHQVGMLDVLSAARLLGREPKEVVVVGVVPGVVDLQVGLSDAVERAIPQAAKRAAQVLRRWLEN
ncbi:MAG: hydrogenase maturation protease [Propionibacteriaceae bacterium]|nr:hydrogenase maturation protease [Propionibacteriaceae bacterium]